MTKKEKKLLAVLMVLIMGFTMLPGNFSAAMSDIINTATEASGEDKQTTEKQTETATTEVVTTAADTSIESTENGESTTMAATVESSIVDTEQQTEAVTTQATTKVQTGKKVKKANAIAVQSAGVSKDMGAYVVGGDSVVKINGETLIVGQEVDVPYGSTISINLAWAFVNGDFPTSQDDEMVYKLPKKINFTPTTKELKDPSGTTVLGHFYLSGNIIRVKYDAGEASENFLKTDGRIGSLYAEGTLDGDITNNGNGGKNSFEFPGLGTFYFDMGRDSSNDKVSIEKTGGDVITGSLDNLESSYALKITATGPHTDVVVSDTMGENLSVDGAVTFYTDAACTQPYSGVTGAVNADGHGFSYTIPSMTDGQVLYAKYNVKVNKNIYLYNPGYTWENGAGNVANVKSTERPNGTSSTKNLSYTKKEWATKTGIYNEQTGTIDWKIKVNPGGNFDISGSVLKDVLSDNTCELQIGTFSTNIPGLTWEALKAGTFVMPEGSTLEYYINYTTTDGTILPNKKNDKKNTFTITPWNNKKKSISAEDTVSIGTNHTYIYKTCKTTGNSDEVEWEIKVDVPATGMNNLIVEDELPTGMSYSYNAGDFTLTSGNDKIVDSANYPKVEAGTNGPKITFGKVTEGEIVFTLKTKIDSIPNKTTTYTNKAKCKDGNNDCGEASDVYTYTVVSYIDKKNVWKSNSNVSDWKVVIDTLPTTAGTVVVTDTLPDNMDYIDSSLKVCTQDNSSAMDTGLTADVIVSKSTGKIEFAITGDALNYVKQSGNKLYLFYSTQIVDYSKNLTGNYINTAKITVDGIESGEASASEWKNFNKQDLVDKTGVYTKDTAPNVEYTIIVNKSGADLNPGGDTLTLEDTLGSAMQYYPGSMEINGNKANASQVSYDATSLKLTITVPDSTMVTVKYKATVTLPVGSELNAANSTNNCVLKGNTTDGLGDDHALSGFVLQSSGTSSSNGVSIVIHKQDATSLAELVGAKFKCSKVTYNAQYNVTTMADVATAQSNTNGIATFGTLNKDVLYRIVETEAPTGYKLDSTPHYFIFKQTGTTTPYPTQITENGQTYAVTVSDENTTICNYSISNVVKPVVEEGSIQLTKTLTGLPADTEALDKISFEVKDASGTVVRTYKLSEFTQDSATKIYSKVITGCEVGNYTVTETATDLTGYRLASTTYKVGTTDGIGKAATIAVTKDNTTTVAYTNTYQSTSHSVQISKVDITSSKELAGASLRITDKATGAEVTTWTSGSDKDAVGNLIPHTITLAEGTYILTETKAPADYKVADPIEFTVASDGTVTSVTAGAASGTKVTMKDATIDKGKLKITKTISGTVTQTQAEASVQFTVVDNSDQQVVGTYQLSDFTYDATNKIWTKELDCNVGGYKVTEAVTAIGGYMLSKVSYVIDSAAAQDGEVATANVTKGTTTTVAYTNTYDPAAHSVDISKVDAAKGEEIAGAELTITNKTSNLVVAKWTSGDKKDAVGNLIPHTVTLAAGTYTLTETKAPTGYEVADPIDFTVGNDGKVTSTTHASNIVGVNKVVMKDVKEKPGTLKLTKTVAGTVSKEDAEKTIQFKVTDAAGTEVATYKLSEFTYDTASKTWTKTLDCTAGKYTVTETVTDITGYTLASVTYTIDRGAETTGKAADVTLVKGNVTTVAFKNSYQESPTTTEATTTETATEVTTEATTEATTETTTEITTEVTTEQVTTDEDKTEVETHSKETTGKKTKSKKTGDTAPIAATGGMLLISLVGLGVLYRKKKKND